MFSDNPNSYGSLEAARALLAKNPSAREQLLDCLVKIEKSLQSGTSANVREDLTGPIVDLLIDPNEIMKRNVANGMSFNFRYSSKIARDFVLARETMPDHVWEPQTTRTIVSLSRGKKNVIIGGAYFGDHALFVARALAAGGICHCFELSSDSIDMLKRNLRDNAISNVIVTQEALWSSDGDRISLSGSDFACEPTSRHCRDGWCLRFTND